MVIHAACGTSVSKHRKVARDKFHSLFTLILELARVSGTLVGGGSAPGPTGNDGWAGTFTEYVFLASEGRRRQGLAHATGHGDSLNAYTSGRSISCV